MAMRAAVLSDDTLLSRLDRGLYRLERVFGLVSGLAVFALMFLAVYSVAGRNILNSAVRGSWASAIPSATAGISAWTFWWVASKVACCGWLNS